MAKFAIYCLSLYVLRLIFTLCMETKLFTLIFMLKRGFFTLLFLIFGFQQAVFAQVDSLERLIPNLKEDSVLLNTLLETAWRYRLLRPEKTIEYARKAQNLLPKLSQYSPQRLAYWANVSHTYASVGYRNIGDFSSAIDQILLAISVAEQNHLEDRIAFNKQYSAELYRRLKQFETAQQYALESIKLFEKLNHRVGKIYAYQTLSSIYREIKNYKEAYAFWQKASDLDHAFGKPISSKAAELSSLGALQWYIGKEEIGIRNIIQSLDYFDKEQDKYGKIRALHSISEIFFQKKEYQKALYYLRKANQELQSKLGSEEFRFQEEMFAKIYAALNRFDSAYWHQQRLATFKDSVFSYETNLQLSRMKVLMETSEKETHISLLKEEQIYVSFQRNAFIAISLLGLILVIFLVSANSQRRKTNNQLQQQKGEIETQTEELLHTNNALNIAYNEIQVINKNVFDSINYAQRIQQATLPFESQFDKIFAENYFILFKPRDVVSGDFYFLEEISLNTEKTAQIIAVVDCTGHGVPGAFMSMVANQILSESILKMNIYEPDQILENLHKEVRRTLRQSENRSQDGMDIAVVTVYQNAGKNEVLEYAGAMNSLFYVYNNDFFEIKASKKSIGGKQEELIEQHYEKHTFELENFEGAMFYLCTDGYQDQFGGENDKKFMVKRLKALLHTLADSPNQIQKQVLEKTFEDWIKQANQKQIDDVTILGFRIKNA